MKIKVLEHKLLLHILFVENLRDSSRSLIKPNVGSVNDEGKFGNIVFFQHSHGCFCKLSSIRNLGSSRMIVSYTQTMEPQTPNCIPPNMPPVALWKQAKPR